MWATTKAIVALGAVYLVAGVAVTVGMTIGYKVADKLCEKVGLDD